MADLRAEILPVAIFLPSNRTGNIESMQFLSISLFFFAVLRQGSQSLVVLEVPLGMVPFRADAILQSLMMIEKK